MTFDLEKNATKLLVLLLLADLVFILLQVPYKMQLVTNLNFWIEQGRGYAEVYQFIKEYWIGLMLFFIAIKRTRAIYFAWSLLFIYLLIDDSLELHENFGRFLVNYFGFRPAFGLPAFVFGELTVSIFFGTLLFLFIAVAYFLSDSKAKEISRHLFILILLLVFFGIILDTFHVFISWDESKWGDVSILGVIEDGGEMLIMSIIVWYVFKLDFTKKEPKKVFESA
jgi:hypothetical protein